MGIIALKRVFKSSILRSRKFLLLLSIMVFVACTMYFEKSIPFLNMTSRSVFSLPKDFDILSQRTQFHNPVYKNWNGQSRRSLEADLHNKCQAYFHHLRNLYPHDIVDLEALQYTPVDQNLYKKKKWIREREKSVRKELSEQGKRLNAKHNIEIEKEFILRSFNISQHEQEISSAFNHMRVWGKCFIDDAYVKIDEPYFKLAGIFESKLYPWLSNSLPRFQNWKGETLPENEFPIYDKSKNPLPESTGSFIHDFQEKSNGKGIVIPIISTYNRGRQISNVCRLIRSLRALKNNIPIEVTYMKSDSALTDAEIKQIIEAARTEVAELPPTYKAYYKLQNPDNNDQVKFVNERDFPKQEIWFVDLSPLKNIKQHPLVAKNEVYKHPNFVYTLGTIFNSFEQLTVLSPHTIPLIEIDQIFQLESFQEHGHLLFKLPSYYQDSKIKKFPPGFHEITSLIENNLFPSELDSQYFQIAQRDKDLSSTNRIFRDNFDKLIDPHMMVFNKSKVLSGLLMGCNFQIYKLLSIRFATAKDQLKLEHMWVGQELAGTSSNFNFEYGVGTGILTPKSNRQPKGKVSMAQEICSSSWGQINLKDQLLYITSYQLDNIIGDPFKFKTDLEKKYLVIHEEIIMNDDGTNRTIETIDRSLFDKKVRFNPLLVENVMKVPTITNPLFSENIDYLEPSQAWIKQDNFGGFKGFPFWCSYDVVGDSIDGQRGIVVNVSPLNQAKYKFLIDVWEVN